MHRARVVVDLIPLCYINLDLGPLRLSSHACPKVMQRFRKRTQHENMILFDRKCYNEHGITLPISHGHFHQHPKICRETPTHINILTGPLKNLQTANTAFRYIQTHSLTCQKVQLVLPVKQPSQIPDLQCR